MNLLSEFDVAVLNAARRVLMDVAAAASTVAYSTDGGPDQGRAGYLAGLTAAAEESVFTAMNIAATRCNDPWARVALEPPLAPELEDAKHKLRRVLCPASDVGGRRFDATAGAAHEVPVSTGPRAVT